MQCFVFNMRRPQFQDRRVRQAFALAFDFEWANKNLFFGQYARVGSYFQGTELAAPADLPQGRELEILNEVKDQVPPEVFTAVHTNPVNNGPDDLRGNLRKAVQLLKEAGYEVKDGVLIDTKTGKQLTVEFLLVSPLFERIVQPYIANLQRLGIKATLRMVDSAQYTRRLNVFDYDIVVGNFAQSKSPATSSATSGALKPQAARARQNLIGIKDPAIDKLVDQVIFAKNREELRGGHTRARPGAVVERLRRAAMVLAEGAHRLLGPLWPARETAGLHPAIHASVVARQRARRQSSRGHPKP